MQGASPGAFSFTSVFGAYLAPHHCPHPCPRPCPRPCFHPSLPRPHPQQFTKIAIEFVKPWEVLRLQGAKPSALSFNSLRNTIQV